MAVLPKISVIIPVFNTGTTIYKCMDSVLKQTFEDFEILLIDDGSTDKSSELCDWYARQYSKVRVFHQENTGPSGARNKGIEKARGTYIVFIDADDSVGDEYLEGFFRMDEVPQNTLVQQGYLKKSVNGKKESFDYEKQTYAKSDFSDLILNTEFIRRFPMPWGKLYQAKIIKENEIRFPADIRFGEDLIFLLRYLQYVETITLVDINQYVYEYTDSSLTKNYNEFRFEIKAFEMVDSYLKEIIINSPCLSTTAHDYKLYLVNYINRAFQSLYLGDSWENGEKRISAFKNLKIETLNFFIKFYRPKNKYDKVFIFLLRNRYYFLLDRFMILRYKIWWYLKRKIIFLNMSQWP